MDPLDQILRQIDESVNSKYPEKKYQDCYVAFLDILGMKNLLDKPYQDLRKIFNSIESTLTLYAMSGLPGGERFLSQNQIRVTVMSDSIVLSIRKEVKNSLSKLLGISSAIINKLINVLDDPVFIRGGISEGQLSHTQFSVFGKGLVESYLLEEKVAVNMRCIISPELYSQVDFKDYIAKNDSLVKDKTDDLYFIKYVNDINRSKIREYAQLAIKTFSDNNKICEKYKWLLQYSSY